MNDISVLPSLNRRHLLVVGASSVLLSGCGNLLGLDNPPNQIYVLAPALPDIANASRISWQLVVERPEASASLTTDRIVLQRGAVMDYYANAQWTDSIPQLMQDLFVEALEKNGAMDSVGKDVSGIRADYLLQSEIRSFEARYDSGDGAPTIVIDVLVKLLRSKTADIVAGKEFRHEQPASANSVSAVVQAFDQAAAALLEDVVRWVLATTPTPK